MTSISVKSMPRPCAHSISGGNSSSLTPLSATALILIFRPAVLRRVDAGKHLVQRTPARDGAEFLRIERIERHVEPPHASRLDLLRIFGELRAVGGQRQLVESAGAQVARQRGDEGHDAAADQRLAAGEAKLAHAARDEGRAQPVEFFERQQIGLGQEGHVLRHAVDAAEIAAIGDRDAQIGDVAAERIDQRRPPGGTIKLPRLCTVHRHTVCFHAAHRHALPRHFSPSIKFF